jgi:ABC-2 type transport system ATP-binding protein
MYLLETKKLSYKFRKHETILNNIDLEVPEHSIYGFLGPNGAGKTTTLKLIVGLLKKQEGKVRIFGRDFDKDRLNILQQIGTLIESPSLYLHLTAKENLLLYQRIYQCPVSRIGFVLELTGLSKTGNKPCSTFSLGMKQRLAISVAMLSDPKLLILDEPTNGLDPAGIIEMRELLKTINRENGITILISSHLLDEIEKIATHSGIIDHGILLFQGSMTDLMQKQNRTGYLEYQTSNNAIAKQLLEERNISVQELEETLFLPWMPKDQIAAINRLMMEQEIDLYHVHIPKSTLEHTFMNLINKN